MRRVIINADDLGYDPAIDRGILQAAREGVVTSASVMVNLPGAEAAVRAALSQGRPALGLHVNLSRGPSRGGRALDEAAAVAASAAEVEAEIWAQLERFRRLAGRAPTHLDVHRHLHRYEGVLAALVAVAQREGLPIRTLDAAMRARVRAAGVATPDAFLGETGARPYWSAWRLCEALRSAGEGTTEIMCHPGFRPESISTSYGVQREAELAAVLAPSVAAAARELELTTFLSLRRR
jgi:predicted glycoside hydrolase/deacetylase ChbG (UPF0249 family)